MNTEHRCEHMVVGAFLPPDMSWGEWRDIVMAAVVHLPVTVRKGAYGELTIEHDRHACLCAEVVSAIKTVDEAVQALARLSLFTMRET